MTSPADWTHPRHWLGRRVLVTGAGGFIGGHLARQLAEAGAQVHGTWHSRMPHHDMGLQAHPALLPDDAGRVFAHAQPEVVFHLAAPVAPGTPPDRHAQLRSGILDATIAVAAECLRQGARLVHVGTCESLAGGPVPFQPDCVRPTSAYSALKAAASGWVSMMAHSHGLDACVVRPFRTWGPAERKGLVAEAARRAAARQPFDLTAGDQVREWNHVDAIVTGLIALGAHPEARGGQWTLGGGPKLSVLDLTQRIFDAFGAPMSLVSVGARPKRPGEVAQFYGDHTRTNALIGPLPHPPLDAALAELVECSRHAEVPA